MAFNSRIHDRLCCRRLICFVVAMPAIANKIDDNVFPESLPIGQGQTRNQNHGLGIVAVHVEYRRFDHLRDVTAIICRTRVRRPTRRKANLVIDDDMQAAARTKAVRLRHLKGFGNDALRCKGCVTVNKNRQNFLTFGIAAALLACPNRSFHNRIDDLEMRWIKSKDEVNVSARRFHVRGKALVIFNIARTL